MSVATPAARPPVAAHCAIDFGTSNSGIALPQPGGGVRLVELEPGHRTMPTAVFHAVDDHEAGPEFVRTPAPGDEPWRPSVRAYGRAAVGAYVDGLDGRLMRSMKSVLGSPLIEQSTDVGGGRSVRYLDVIAGYLQHLKRLAEAEAGATPRPRRPWRPPHARSASSRSRSSTSPSPRRWTSSSRPNAR